MLYQASYQFHTAIQAIAHRKRIQFDVQPVSAESLPELNAANTSQLIILGEYSYPTIFGEPSLNHLQRAWHDGIHLALQADTSKQGEYRVARQQCCELERIAGTTLADILWSDIYGQTLYYEKYQGFPTNQLAFTWHYYTTGEITQF